MLVYEALTPRMLLRRQQGATITTVEKQDDGSAIVEVRSTRTERFVVGNHASLAAFAKQHGIPMDAEWSDPWTHIQR